MTTRWPRRARPWADSTDLVTATTPRPVASTRPGMPPRSSGLPVTTAGDQPARDEYASMTQPMTLASVLTSGARMSVVGPMTPEMAWVKLRVAASSSREDSVAGSMFMPPLAPPNGRSRRADFQVISDARARTSSRSVSRWKRRPPLNGPRAIVLHPVPAERHDRTVVGVNGDLHIDLPVGLRQQNPNVLFKLEQRRRPVDVASDRFVERGGHACEATPIDSPCSEPTGRLRVRVA